MRGVISCYIFHRKREKKGKKQKNNAEKREVSYNKNMEQKENGKIAILIDAENTNYKKISDIIQEVSLYGHIITKRAYGNWKNCAEGWVRAIKNNAITPIQQFENSKGKNSSDITLVIDAMDLLYSKKYDTFVIVSSDSDFTKLVTRIHDDEIFVIGVGEKKTPEALIKACDEFIYIENLETAEQASGAAIPAAAKDGAATSKFTAVDKEILSMKLRKITETKYADEEGWVNIGSAGSLLRRQDPGFDTRTYGFSSLVKLIEYLGSSFELRRGNNGTGTIEYRAKTKK